MTTVLPFGKGAVSAEAGDNEASFNWLGLFATLFSWLFWIAIAGLLFTVAYTSTLCGQASVMADSNADHYQCH